MAQFRTTADIIDLALRNAGEVTTGTSPYEAQTLDYLNRVHMAIVSGGTIPLGKDLTLEIDEVWPWAKERFPMVLELQPKVTDGTVSFTLGSEVGAFSIAPSASMQGRHIKVEGRNDWFKIASHVAASTAFEIDGAYPDASGSFSYKVCQFDYDLIPSYLIVNADNNKVQFQKAAGVTLTGTVSNGSYTPAQLATAVASAITAAAGGPTVTGSYSSTTRLFSFVSDLAGGTIFRIVGNGDQSLFSIHRTLGFDDDTTTSAATQTSVYILGGISRLIEPIRVHKGSSFTSSITGLDSESFQRKFPFNQVEEGVPDRFCVLREASNGALTLRFNAYPSEKTRIEVEHVAVPRDLKDNSSSIPLVPRKHVDVLEDAATFYVMLNKSDDRMQVYANLMQGKIKAMISQHRGALARYGENFGQIVARKDKLNVFNRKLTVEDT
jgi:hypothetical protein